MIDHIIWSKFAETQLDDIYTYYKNKASLKVATKLVKGIINAPSKLLKAPYMGKEEELLRNRKTDYRFLIFKNYKLIYSVDEDQGRIKIADVFDVRQNPSKIVRSEII